MLFVNGPMGRSHTVRFHGGKAGRIAGFLRLEWWAVVFVLALLYQSKSVAAACSATSCDGCVSVPGDGCGWDGTACRSGNSSGPTVGSYTSWWYYFPCDCNANTQCGVCTLQVGCGWDGLHCRTGSASGPLMGGSTGTWMYGFCASPEPAPGLLDSLGAIFYILVALGIAFVLCVAGCVGYHCRRRQLSRREMALYTVSREASAAAYADLEMPMNPPQFPPRESHSPDSGPKSAPPEPTDTAEAAAAS